MTINWSELTGTEGFDEALQLIRDLYRGGMSYVKIATLLSRPGYPVSSISIKNLLKAAGEELRGPGGRHKHDVVISAEDLEKLTYKQLAVKYEVSEWTIWQKVKVNPHRPPQE